MATRAAKSATSSKSLMKLLDLVPAVIRPPEVQANGVMAPADGWDAPGCRRLASGVLPMADFERAGSRVIGAYRATRENIGVNESRIYDFADPETGELFGVWGSTILDQRMDILLPKPGDFLRIIYLGDVITGRAQNPAHNFEVDLRPAALGPPPLQGK